MENWKNILHKNSIAKLNYNKKFKPVGLSFKEYCDYIYYGTGKNKSELVPTKIYNVDIKRIGNYSFVQNVEELLVDEIYKFQTKNDSPVIIDCGSNIGLSIIYFKKLFPKAQITAFEPDYSMYETCKYNLNAFGYNDVKLINAAVWKQNDQLSFLPDNSLGGRIISEEISTNIIKVDAVRLRDLLDRRIDMLKIDIEGAEFEVLDDCKNHLNNIENIFIEYHSSNKKPQQLHDILEIIKKAGFRYYIKPAWDFMRHPFVDNKNIKDETFDLQLNIFAYKK